MRKENFEQVEKLSFDEMAEIRGGSNFTDCASQVLGGMGTIGSTAAALAWGDPVGWGLAGIGAGSLIFSLIGNIYACDRIFG